MADTKPLKLKIRSGGLLGAMRARMDARKSAMDEMFPGEKKKKKKANVPNKG